jgi:hypothetical protein
MSIALNALATSIAKLSSVSGVSRFEDLNQDKMTFSQWVIFVTTFLLLLFILMFLGTKVFNLTIPKIIPSIRKVTTSEFFGLYVILHILFC